MKVFSLYIISMMRYYKMVLMFNLYLVRPKATSALYGEEDLNLLLQQCSCHPLNHLSCIPESLLEHHIPITGTNILVSSSSLDTKSGTLLRTAISNCCDCRILRDIVLSCFLFFVVANSWTNSFWYCVEGGCACGRGSHASTIVLSLMSNARALIEM